MPCPAASDSPGKPLARYIGRRNRCGKHTRASGGGRDAQRQAQQELGAVPRIDCQFLQQRKALQVSAAKEEGLPGTRETGASPEQRDHLAQIGRDGEQLVQASRHRVRNVRGHKLATWHVRLTYHHSWSRERATNCT